MGQKKRIPVSGFMLTTPKPSDSKRYPLFPFCQFICINCLLISSRVRRVGGGQKNEKESHNIEVSGPISGWRILNRILFEQYDLFEWNTWHDSIIGHNRLICSTHQWLCWWHFDDDHLNKHTQRHSLNLRCGLAWVRHWKSTERKIETHRETQRHTKSQIDSQRDRQTPGGEKGERRSKKK